MRWKRTVARVITELSAWRSGPRAGLRVLLYHAVGTVLPDDTYGISIAPRVFERHMEALTRGPWTAVPVTSSPPPLGLAVAVTFDDGYRDNLHAAAPVLQRLNLPFAVFVTSGFVDSDPIYLTRAELRELASIPRAIIGSHGATHARLATCDDRGLRHELVGSRRRLEDIIGRPVTTIAYPHGSVDSRVVQAAMQAGYTTGVCSHFDINRPGADPMALSRTEIVAADSERIFLQKVSGAWDWYRWRTGIQEPNRAAYSK